VAVACRKCESAWTEEVAAQPCSGEPKANGAAGRWRGRLFESSGARQPVAAGRLRHRPRSRTGLGLRSDPRSRGPALRDSPPGRAGSDVPGSVAGRAAPVPGTHRQECLTRQGSTTIDSYPRERRLPGSHTKALQICCFSARFRAQSWWIAPRRSGVRVPLAPLSSRPLHVRGFRRLGNRRGSAIAFGVWPAVLCAKSLRRSGEVAV
jgi:hypothetical protein